MSRQIKKHPVAVEWDEWIDSPEGKIALAKEFGSCVHLPQESIQYLKNRLWYAFIAGVQAAQKTRNDFEFSKS